MAATWRATADEIHVNVLAHVGSPVIRVNEALRARARGSLGAPFTVAAPVIVRPNRIAPSRVNKRAVRRGSSAVTRGGTRRGRTRTIA